MSSATSLIPSLAMGGAGGVAKRALPTRSHVLTLPPGVLERGILSYLSTKDGNAVRLTCTELRDAAKLTPWVDCPIVCRLASWRAAFPLARAAYVGRFWREGRVSSDCFTDADFVHLAGIRTLRMMSCRQLTGAALEPVKDSVTSLTVAGCSPSLQAAAAAIARTRPGVKIYGDEAD